MAKEQVVIYDYHTRELIEEGQRVMKMLHEGEGYMDDNDLMQYLLLLFQRIGEEVALNAMLRPQEGEDE